ncbi:MAG: disulfide bond formation protein B [Proteobacteria bacterium]|nr:disulfide bond formation protein B [Pseudomonadota bacterium]
MSITIRPLYFLLLAFSLFLLGGSFVLQFLFHLEPCPLCIIDRVLVFILTIFFVIALWHNPKHRGQQVYSFIGFFIASLGILSSARHLWIIHLPPELAPDCGPGIDYLFGTLPPHEALLLVLRGSGECAVNKSAFLGFPIPGWTLISFILLALGSLLPWWGKKRTA